MNVEIRSGEGENSEKRRHTVQEERKGGRGMRQKRGIVNVEKRGGGGGTARRGNTVREE